MNQDRLLKKTLRTRNSGDLRYGFENLAMKRILLEAAKQKKRSAFLSLGLVSLVSLVMIVGLVLVLKIYFSVDISFHIPLENRSDSMLGFYTYIAFIVLVLLGFDTFFRSWKKKPDEK